MITPRSHCFSFSVIRNSYSRAVLLTARKWEKSAHRISANYCRLAFLHNCIKEDLPPKSLRRKPAVESIECRQAVRQFQRRTMRAIINDLHRRIDGLKTWTDGYREQCRRVMTDQHFRALAQYIRSATRRTSQRTTGTLQRRTAALRELDRDNTAQRLVCNLSAKTLTHPQLTLLQRDAGCNLTDAHTLDFVAALEPALFRTGLGEEGKNTIRQQVTGLLMGHKRHQALSRKEMEALEQLRKDHSIVVLPADKGRATVVMDRAQYIDKALELLKDTTAYKVVVGGDPMVTLKNRLNKILGDIKRGKRMEEGVLRRIRPGDSALARFYGLPKIHKVGVPLRPIVAFRDTPTSGLAKWLSNKLSHLVNDSPTTVKSAGEFLGRIKSLRVEGDELMVSFDVVSLFTSIPQDLAIAVIRDQLNQKGPGQDQDPLRTEDLMRLLEVCLKTYFTFQGTTFEQIKGTPMGSPISSVIAEAVLQQLEHVAMAQYHPKFWARYVDDTFVVIKRDQKAGFVEVLNSVYPDIQFTEEEENQGALAFLDVLVRRRPDGTLSTEVYRKPTHTDRILHFTSNHPVAHKASCIRTLFGRIDSHCSTAKAKREERRHLLRVCRCNGYPTGFIRRHSVPPKPREQPGTGEPAPQTTRVTLPYINNVSEATARLLAPHKVKVAHRPSQTLRSKVMRPKDPLPSVEKSAVVYRIDCKDCPGNYVGETSKRVKTRVHEHKLAVKRGEQRSQVWAHMAESGHCFDFNNVRVLASDNTKGGRLLKEAWLSNGDSINRHIDLCPAHLTLKAWSAGDPQPQHGWQGARRHTPVEEIRRIQADRGATTDILESSPSPHPPPLGNQRGRTPPKRALGCPTGNLRGAQVEEEDQRQKGTEGEGRGRLGATTTRQYRRDGGKTGLTPCRETNCRYQRGRQKDGWRPKDDTETRNSKSGGRKRMGTLDSDEEEGRGYGTAEDGGDDRINMEITGSSEEGGEEIDKGARGPLTLMRGCSWTDGHGADRAEEGKKRGMGKRSHQPVSRGKIGGKKGEGDGSAWTRVRARSAGDEGRKGVEEVYDGTDRSEETVKVEVGRMEVGRGRKREGRQPHGVRDGNWRTKEGQRGEEEDRGHAMVEDEGVSRSDRTNNREEGRESGMTDNRDGGRERREEERSNKERNESEKEVEERKMEVKGGVRRVVKRPQRVKGRKDSNWIGSEEEGQEEGDREQGVVEPAARRAKGSVGGEERDTEEPYDRGKWVKEGWRGEEEDRERSNKERNESQKEVEERKMEVKGGVRRVAKRPQRVKETKDDNWIGSEEGEQEEGDREQGAVEPVTQREKGSVGGEERDTENSYGRRKWEKEGRRGEEEDRECVGEGGGGSKVNVIGDRDGGREGTEDRQINNGGNESRMEVEGRRREVKERMRKTAKRPQGRKGGNWTGSEDDGQKEGDREQGTVGLAIQHRKDGGNGEELEDIGSRCKQKRGGQGASDPRPQTEAISNITHAGRGGRRKLTTGVRTIIKAQPNRLGPVTRSRSRAQMMDGV